MAQEKNNKTDPVVDAAVEVLDRFFPPPRRFAIRLWNGMELPAGAAPVFTLVLNNPGALGRIFNPPMELSAGEAYIYGDIDIEGDFSAATGLLDDIADMEISSQEIAAMLKEVRRLPQARPERDIQRKPAELRGELHSRERDREAVRFHFDVGNEFFALWLDRHMQYSCGYFSTGEEDLDTAQELKIRAICGSLQLKPGEKLLDIGCGWGGLALAAANWYGADATGVTLSENQAVYGAAQAARAGLDASSPPRGAGRVNIRCSDYRDLQDETYDKIASVRMFEHVGRSHLPEYFSQVYRLLKPGGLFLVQGNTRCARPSDLSQLKGLDLPAVPAPARKDYFTVPQAARQSQYVKKMIGAGSFSQHYIFPDGELVPFSEAALIAESAGFEVCGVENLREHYVHTVKHWVRRLEARQDEAVRLVGAAVYRTWWLYLSFLARGFTTRQINAFQILLAKPAGA